MGNIVASYLVRVTLRRRDDLPPPDEAPPGTFHSESEPPVPKIAEMELVVKDVLYDSLTYYTEDVIGVSAERTDR